MCLNIQTSGKFTVTLNSKEGIINMDNEAQNIKETTTRTGDTVQKTTQISNPQDTNKRSKNNILTDIIAYLTGLLIVILGIRLFLALFGANPANIFAKFIYNTSHPFVIPFFSLFNYHSYNYAVAHFEIYTLVAIIVYALIAWGIIKLIKINQK